VAERVRMRKETGMDPQAINQTVTALAQFHQAVNRLKVQMSGALSPEAVSSILEPLEKAYADCVSSVNHDLMSRMVIKYNKFLPNFRIPYAKVVAEMRDRFGDRGLDAGVLEDTLLKYIRDGRRNSFDQMLAEAKLLLLWRAPKTRWTIAQKRALLNKKTLTFPRAVDGWDGTPHPINLQTRLRLDSLERLSRVMLCGADPVTVTSTLYPLLMAGPPSNEDLERGIRTRNGSPIKIIRLRASGMLQVTYGTPEAALTIVQALTSTGRNRIQNPPLRWMNPPASV